MNYLEDCKENLYKLTHNQNYGNVQDINYCIDLLNELFKDKCDIKIHNIKSINCNNIIALIDNKSKNTISIVCHLDVVKCDKELLDCTEKNNRIYVRGAVDMKGAIACILAVIKNEIENLNSNILLIMSGDEEQSSNGIKDIVKYLENDGKKYILSSDISLFDSLKFAICPEPSSINEVGDNIKNARMSNVNVLAKIHKPQMHTGYTKTNAFNQLVECLNYLMKEKFNNENDKFHIIDMNTNSDQNIKSKEIVWNCTPESAKARINIRSMMNINEIKEIFNQVKQINNDFEYEIIKFSNPFKSSISNDMLISIKNSIKKITNKNVTIINNGGTSDMKHFYHLCPYIEIGLINKTMHSNNENVHIKDLEILYMIYKSSLFEISNIINK